tara:strand:+ start:152 stop:289 length:138 start_codon:yes stop_codon:yes gene_type:complete
MPVVNGKKYPYNSAGKKAAKKALQVEATVKPKYSKGHKQKSMMRA